MGKLLLKKYFALFVIFIVFTLSFSSCKNNEDVNAEKGEIKEEVVETIQGPTEEELLQVREAFDGYTVQLAREVIESSPLNASFMYGDLESLGLTHLLYELDDANKEAMLEQVDDAEKVLQDLEDMDYDLLSKEQQITYDLVKFHNQGIKDGEEYLYYYNVFQPTSGAQIELPLALMQIELESELEVQAYIERVKNLPRLYEEYIVYEKERAKQGLLLPSYMYDLIIEQIDEMLVEPEDYMLYLSFCDRVDALESIEEAAKDSYKLTFLEIIRNDIYPSFEGIKTALSEIKLESKNNVGLSEWGEGHEYYNYLIKYATSYNMDAEGLRNWANQQLQLSSTALQTFLSKHPDVAQMVDLSPLLASVASEEEMLKYEEEFLEEAFLDYGFDRATENIIPTYLEEHLPPAFYFPISIDGEDYGNMYMAEEAFNDMSISTLETDIHENIPGHHLYFSVLYNSDIPLIQKVYDFDGYVEGWAQYVQGKAYEIASLDEEMAILWSNLMIMNYAYQVLLDIQVNYDGISKQQAIETLLSMNYDSETAESVYNRMIANPGEMIDYYYGCYKIESYLDECQEELDSQFDIKEFHDLILKNGNVPFKIMDHIVDDFIDETVE